MRRTGALALVSALVLLLPGAAGATSTSSGTPFLGDLNLDGRPDRVALGPTDGRVTTCTVTVEDRRADGTYAPPVTRTFPSHATSGPYCPTTGQVVDLGGDGAPEIVATHTGWSRPGKNLVVLRDSRVVAELPGLDFPSSLRKADFDGDGRVDLWQTSNQVMRLKTWRNTPAGGLEPGAVDVCSSEALPQHALADYDGDGGQDLLLVRRCEFSYVGAEVRFGGGKSAVVFASGPRDGRAYEVFVTDRNGDDVPDVGVIEKPSGGAITVRHFVNDGTGAFTEV